ncbi:MAG: hypothetical protein KGY67_00295, partial [Candidatus Thermoplasmatota archaeon]|nr:hypothetical protein [Candidatus Thermoplasmatota archaeon]
ELNIEFNNYGFFYLPLNTGNKNILFENRNENDEINQYIEISINQAKQILNELKTGKISINQISELINHGGIK